MTITFDTIPPTGRVPFVYVEFDNSLATATLAPLKLQTLLVGQRLSTGTVGSLEVRRVTSVGQAANYFGHGSMLEAMASAFLLNNRTTDLWCIALDEPSGGQASGTVTISGTATEAGVLNVYLHGVLIQIGVAAGDTGDDVATEIAAAVSSDTGLQATCTALNGVATFVANQRGVIGNELDLRINYRESDRTPSGLTAVATEMSGGTTTVDLSTLWAAIGEEQYHIIAFPYTDPTNLDSADVELADRWGGVRQNDGVLFTASSDDLNGVSAFGATRNGPHVCVLPAFGSPSPTLEIAAATAAQVAAAATDDPARPFKTLPLVGVLAPSLRDRFTIAQREVLLANGISTIVGSADGSMRIELLITTYQTNQFGAKDVSYLLVNTLTTDSRLRYDFRTYIQTKYPRHKLADDGTRFGPGQPVVTPSVLRAEAIALARQWEEQGLIEDADEFKANLVVERDANDPNRVNFLLPPNLINQFSIAAAKIQFRL